MTLAIIPARAGSKGIKNKNLALLCEKPLLHWSIKAAKEAKCIDKIVLSSDGDEILEYAKSQGIDTLKRPLSLALDDSKSQDVVLHVLESYKNYDDFILLQPTSPFRTKEHIDNAFNHFKKTKANALISVLEYDNKILKAFILNDKGELRGICDDSFPFMPRQKLPQTFMSNGAIYIVKVNIFLKNPSFLQDKTTYFIMDKQSSMDIDNPSDLKLADKIMRLKIK